MNNSRSRKRNPKGNRAPPKSVKNGEVVIAVKTIGAEEAEPIYANHTTVNINPFESTITFSYVDGLKVAKILEGATNSKAIEAKTQAKVVLPHRALVDLHRAIGELIQRVRKDRDEKTTVQEPADEKPLE